MANTIFREIVMRCDYGIDLHTASVRRTNFPNVRGDLTDPRIQQFARSFGSEIIIHGHGPEGSFAREACTAGVPTIIMEGGEVWKVEPVIVAAAVRGIKNALIGLGMLDGEPERPPYQVEIEHTKWIRAERGGFLQFHVQPGDIVEQDQPLATNTNLLGREKSYLCAPFPAVVVGMTTLPAVSPGEPVCHLGRLPDKTDPSKFRRLRQEESGLEEKMMEDLASNVLVVDPPEDREI